MYDKELENEFPKALLKWYDFKENSDVIVINSNTESRYFDGNNCNVIYADTSEINTISTTYNAKFDYIITVADIEKEQFPVSFLMNLKKMIKSTGHLLLAMNNRIGLRYFCGDRDPYTEYSFDSIDGYCRSYSSAQDMFEGRMYDKSEITDMLNKSGWERFKFFSVISDLNNPYLIFSENYLPNEDLANRVFPTYNYPDSVFLEEETLYQTLINNGMFHTLANAFVIECTLDGELSNVDFVTSSLERGKEFATLTIIRDDGTVEKKAAYDEGIYRLRNMIENLNDLSNHGVPVVDTSLENNTLKMQFIKADVGQLYLKKLLYADKEKFFEMMDYFRDLILKSSDIVSEDKGDGEGAVLKKGYLDLVPLNSFFINGEFVFYDQEFCEENYPANTLIWRMIETFYTGNPDFHNIIPMNLLIERYNLTPQLSKWQRLEWDFFAKLRNEKPLRIYYEKCRRNIETVNSNRQRINYSDAEYQRLFVNIFDDIGSEKIILFGSGNFTKRFIAMYRKEYPIYIVIDNNNEKWGRTIDGIEIKSPEILKNISENEYRIIVCIKKFHSVVKQLDSLGFRNYRIFDAGRSYPKQQISINPVNDKKVEKKKYHIGYVAGVFDMFHIGHLNMLKRAKEQCDYLIVGIVPDKGVFEQKNKYPIIPCDERVEMVQCCRYVDRADALPLECRSIRDAYKMYKFDCMFTGTDYVDNPDWLADKEYLQKNGSDIVFFPYTEKTSSTKIREKLIKER